MNNEKLFHDIAYLSTKFYLDKNPNNLKATIDDVSSISKFYYDALKKAEETLKNY